jgi:hypothetical protein
MRHSTSCRSVGSSGDCRLKMIASPSLGRWLVQKCHSSIEPGAVLRHRMACNIFVRYRLCEWGSVTATGVLASCTCRPSAFRAPEKRSCNKALQSKETSMSHSPSVAASPVLSHTRALTQRRLMCVHNAYDSAAKRLLNARLTVWSAANAAFRFLLHMSLLEHTRVLTTQLRRQLATCCAHSLPKEHQGGKDTH